MARLLTRSTVEPFSYDTEDDITGEETVALGSIGVCFLLFYKIL